MTLMHTNMKRHQRGINLIEIMVAMTIGLFLVLGATTLYVRSKKTSDVDDAIARLQETARYAMSIIETDARMANYLGLMKDGAAIENKLGSADDPTPLLTGTDAADCGAAFAIDIEQYIDAANNNYTLGCAASSTAVSSADTLIIRRVATTASAASTSNLQLCSTRSTGRLIRDGSATCTGGEIHDLSVNAYYVDQGSDQSDDLPSLRRKSLISGPDFRDVEVIPGIEDMQIELGWGDDSNTANVVSYLQPGNASLATGHVLAVRVWLLVRAETEDFTYTDTRTYEYGDRSADNGTINDLNVSATGADAMAYAPNDNFRRLLVSRTFFIRNVSGT